MADTETTVSAGKDEAAAQPKVNRKKMAVIGAAVAVIALGGGGAAYAFLGGDETPAAKAPQTVEANQMVDVPPMIVNIRSTAGGARFLKVHLMLVPGSATKEEITARLPIVIDAYQPFLRELRPEDLSGSAATFRLKEEMLVRANAVIGEGSVRDVLIQDLIQQ